MTLPSLSLLASVGLEFLHLVNIFRSTRQIRQSEAIVGRSSPIVRAFSPLHNKVLQQGGGGHCAETRAIQLIPEFVRSTTNQLGGLPCIGTTSGISRSARVSMGCHDPWWTARSLANTPPAPVLALRPQPFDARGGWAPLHSPRGRRHRQAHHELWIPVGVHPHRWLTATTQQHYNGL